MDDTVARGLGQGVERLTRFGFCREFRKKADMDVCEHGYWLD
jgi:hypothetical protein